MVHILVRLAMLKIRLVMVYFSFRDGKCNAAVNDDQLTSLHVY